MKRCSNPRCTRPKPDNNNRCVSCRALLVDTLVRHRYRIEQTMGRGGFGTTYLSRDQDRFDDSCLLKELHPDADGEDDDGTAERLFKREAQVLLTLRHRGIPKLHAYFSEKNYSYLVQDYIPGQTLAEEVENRKRTFNEQEARALLLELAEILEYLHTHNPPIIHRDIKPQNLMRHASGQLLLIDFGAVCQAANSQTLIGSPGYVPPEQIIGRPLPQSDLYAVGATALRLLSGMHPSQLFNNRTQRMEWESHLQVSDGFASLLNDLVKQKANERLSSAAELKQRIQQLKDEPIVTTAKLIKEPAHYELATEIHQGRHTASWQADSQIGAGVEAEVSTIDRFRLQPVTETPYEIGKLDEMPFLFLLKRFYRERFTGLLSCTNESISKTIYFDQGAVVFANSSLVTERLGEMLLRIGRISISDFERAVVVMRHRDLRFGAALIALGCITTEELRPLIITQVSYIIYSLFDWVSGKYEMRRANPPEVTIKISVSTADLIFEGLRRMENIDLVKNWLGSFTRKLTTTTNPLLLYQVVNLNPKEGFIVSRIDSVMSVEEILALGGLPEAETFKTLCGLLAVGILEWVDGQHKDDQHKETSSMALANLLTGSQSLTNSSFDIQTAAEFCYDVENTLHSFNNASHYAVLGVGRKANDEELRETYTHLAKKFHPDRHAQLVNYNLSLRTELEKIFARISEAFNVLINPASRTQYDKSMRGHVKTLTQSHKAVTPNRSGSSNRSTQSQKLDRSDRLESKSTAKAPVRSAAIKDTPRAVRNNKMPDSAYDWFKKGLEYYHSAQFEHASRAFWAATTVAPSEAEYRIYLARSLAMMKGYANETEQEFLKAIDLNPQNPDYYVQLGLFYQKINVYKKAAKMFEKALHLAPAHPLALRAKRSLPNSE